MSRRIKVHFVCTGVDRWRGGIETFFREAFDGLRDLEDIDITLYKTDSTPKPREVRVRSLYRGNRPAKLLGTVLRRNSYIIEQMAFLPGYVRHVRRTRPDVIFYSESNLAYRLWELRRFIGVPYSLLLSNGAPLSAPYIKLDHVQQVTPFYFEQSREAGVPDAMQSMVPYGINVPEGDPSCDPEDVRLARLALNLPLDRPIVLSVGWISATHKRMDYVVSEVARLPQPRPFLVLLGRTDESSNKIRRQAETSLGIGNFVITSVPYEQVARYYLAADVFVLASLLEGFGRVYLEACLHGLPAIAHDHPIPRFVFGEYGHYADMSRAGAMAAALQEVLAIPNSCEARRQRRNWVRSQFSWPALRPKYREMFLRCAEHGPQA